MTDRRTPPDKGMTGQIVTASFEDGLQSEPLCGLEDCECPDHDGPPRPAGTYITIRLDEDAPVGLWRVAVMQEEAVTERDNRDAKYFHDGWVAALREIRLRGDRAVGEFLIEQLGEPESAS